MSSSSESEINFDSDYSDINFIPEVEIEHTRQRAAVREESNSSSDEDNLFADEPLADEAWTASYEKELKTNEEPKIKLHGRLDGSVAVHVSRNGKLFSRFLSPCNNQIIPFI